MKKQLTVFVICIFLNGYLNAKTGLPIQANNNTLPLGNLGKRNYQAGFDRYDEHKLKMIGIWNNYYTASRVMEKSMRDILLAENDTLDQKNPSLLTNVGKGSLYIGVEFLVGEFCGFSISLLGLLVSGLPGGIMGYTLGTSIGVYSVGSNNEFKGSYMATLAGSILGACLGVGIYNASPKSHLGAIAFAFGPPIGSIIGFNIFRKARVSNGEALINYYQERL